MKRRAGLLLLAAGCLREPLEIPGPSEGGFVSGTVVELDAKSGELVPVGGAKVRARNAGLELAASADGFFELSRLPLGLLSLELESPRTRFARRLRGISILASGQSVELGTIELSARGEIAGQVRLASGEPAVGAFVAIARTPFRSAADDKGEFRISGVPEGRYELVAFQAGTHSAALEGIEVSPSETTSTVPFVLQPSSAPVSVTITGRASLEDSDELSAISVELAPDTNPTAKSTAATNAGGEYSLELPVGIFRATFRKEGYRAVNLEGVAVLEEVVIGLSDVRLPKVVAGDADGDGSADAGDSDRDGDGCDNDADAFPDDPSGCSDTDGDSIPNEVDDDDDGDSLPDWEETSRGRDGFVTDSLLEDSDGDSFRDDGDFCPLFAAAENTDSDGDGRGDACDDEPRITGFFPERIGIGSDLTVLGSGFIEDRPELNVIQFGSGVAVAAKRAGFGRLTVTVPAGAVSGFVTIFTGRGVSTSTAALEIVPRPSIDSVRPRRAPPGSRLEALGRGFLDGGPVVRLGTDPNPLSIVESGLAVDGRERCVFEIPVGFAAGEHRLSVAGSGGAAEYRLPIEVLSPPAILQLVPSLVNVGQVLQIVGVGFDDADTSGSLSVRFATASGAVEVAPTAVSDSRIDVVVPDEAVDGPVSVIHPAGEALAPEPLRIDRARPVITRMSMEAARRGETVRLTGANLHSPPSFSLTRVTVGGALVASATAANASIDLTVPDDATAGEVVATIRLADGTSMDTKAPSPLSLFAEEAYSPILNNVIGVGLDATAARFFVLDPANFHELDPLTLERRGTPTPLGIVGVTGFWAFPGRDAAVLTSAQGTYIVRLPGFSLTLCSAQVPALSTGLTMVAEPVPPPGVSIAYGSASRQPAVFRVVVPDDVAEAPTCEEVSVPAGSTGTGLLPTRTAPMHVWTFGPSGGELDLDPLSGTYGQLVSPAPGSFTFPHFVHHPTRSSDIFATGGYITRISLIDGAQSPLLPATGGDGPFLVEPSGRYAMTPTENSSFVDLERGVILRTFAATAPRRLAGGARSTAHPSRPDFYVQTYTGQTRIRLELP
ncbi:MAG: carboxypeptidase regulatory-like domain-containing protein [Deltaproteobacteria bacterium]|nr:carboxypeptidase regulatory-like domain-containing protein [Deltaproteobacteria bacterium]